MTPPTALCPAPCSARIFTHAHNLCYWLPQKCHSLCKGGVGRGGQYRAAHGCKVNSNRVFCFAFVSFFYFFCIKCPPYRQGTRYTRHSVAGVQKGLPWRLFEQRQQQQPHCTLLPACLHFLFGFHGSSRWAAPLPWQASLGVFSLEVIVAAAAALLHISCQAASSFPACLAKSSAEPAGSGQASPVGDQATTCNANGVHGDR